MKQSLAVMQPYFFPYIGYFQLINEVEKLILYDDVTFIKNGWINRNRILINNEAKYYTVPCKGVSSHKLINEIEHQLDDRERDKMLRKLKFTYGKAPCFDEVFDLVENVLNLPGGKISDIAIASITHTAAYLKLDCTFERSSAIETDKEVERHERLIGFCKREGRINYVNPIGGQDLYDKETFARHGVNLYFLQSGDVSYRQFGGEFVPWLSILDVMMFNPVDEIRTSLLKKYTLI